MARDPAAAVGGGKDVASEQRFLAAVEEGNQALREGRVIDHATVVDAFERFVTPGA